jgi:hypothetical protein
MRNHKDGSVRHRTIRLLALDVDLRMRPGILGRNRSRRRLEVRFRFASDIVSAENAISGAATGEQRWR